MRRRLMVAFIALVAGVLVIAGVGSVILTHDAARKQAEQQLVAEAESLTSGTSPTQRKAALLVVRRVLALENARLVRVSVLGLFAPGTPLPPGVTSSDVSPQRLLEGDDISGQDGNLVYAAAPITLSPRERVQLKLRGQFAVVLTRQVGDLGPSWSYFLISGGVALLIAALVAWQMSRRLSRPLVEAMVATEHIAAGDLQSRVPMRPNDYAETLSLAGSINLMAQSLEDGRSRERQLLLSVSHDLRTPLTSIRGFAEAIKDGAIDDTAQAADVIIAESRRLERLVGDLLDLTKLEARQLSISIRSTDVAEVVGTTAEGFRPLALGSGIEMVVHLPADGVPAVQADPDRLAQILANLIENSLTFARTSITVSVGGGGGAGSMAPIVTVEDDGPGIAAGDLPRVFERFYQADRGPSRQVGSGLGLAIVSELAAAMGATVRAESPVRSGAGSRFVVTLAGRAPPLGSSSAEIAP